MSRERDEIIALVEKLLAMTEDAGCTQAEAVAFALRAQRLIAEHHIADDELGNSREPERMAGVESVPMHREWRDLLADVVARNFRCCTYSVAYAKERRRGARRRGNAAIRTVFYGYASDANAAAVTFNHLYRTGHLLASNPKTGRKLKGADYRNFTLGFVQGISDELEKQSQALMLVVPAEVSESFEEMSKDFESARPMRRFVLDMAWRDRGREAGRDAVRAGRLDEINGEYLLG